MCHNYKFLLTDIIQIPIITNKYECSREANDV